MVTADGPGPGPGPDAGPAADGAPTAPDAVHARRAQAALLAKLGKRVGYSLFLVAIVVFVIGALTDFPDLAVTVVVACLVVGSLLLAPAIVVAYGVKAADREERGLPPAH
jgi:hypothetical protein